MKDLSSSLQLYPLVTPSSTLTTPHIPGSPLPLLDFDPGELTPGIRYIAHTVYLLNKRSPRIALRSFCGTLKSPFSELEQPAVKSPEHAMNSSKE